MQLLRALKDHWATSVLPSAVLPVLPALLLLTAPLPSLAAAEHDYGGYYGVITDPHADTVPEDPPPAADDPSPPILGVNFGPPRVRDLTENNLEESTGVVVNEVYPDTAAEEMGLQEGDLIIQIGETDIGSMQSVRDEVMSNSPGDPVEVVVLRDGEEVSVTGNYGRWPETIAYQPIDENADQRYRSIQDRRLARRVARDERDQQRRAHSQLAPAGSLSNGLGAMAERAMAQREEEALSPAQSGDRMVAAGLAMTRRLPAWRFNYAIDVERSSDAFDGAVATAKPDQADNEEAASLLSDRAAAADDDISWLVALGEAEAAPAINLTYRTRVAAGAL
jgi:membrane-associated protease RseP (regulator of RpoE activity)